MRGAALITLFLGLVTLAVAAALRMFEDMMPFSASYAPRHDLLELTYFAGATYLILTHAVAQRASHDTLGIACVAQLALFVVAIAVFVGYRWYYAQGEQPRIFVYDHYERVTPFHEQLAVPAFIALITAPMILYAAVRSERRAVAALAG